MVMLISLPDKRKTARAIRKTTSCIPTLAQLLLFTPAPKWIAFALLFAFSLLAMVKAGDPV